MQSFAIIPAAGRSERMGQHKLLMPWEQSTVIERVLAAWRASRVSSIIIVVRADDEELIAACERAGVSLVVPDTPPPEMKDSVAAGLAHVRRQFAPQDADVWLLAPADMPRLSAQVVDQLLHAHDAQSPSILVPSIAGKRGHPVLFPWPLATEVDSLRPDEGVNALLARHRTRLVPCDDRSILDDLDTPNDYRRLQNRHDRDE